MSHDSREILQFGEHQVEIKRRRFRRRLGVSVYPSGDIRVSANQTLSQREILRFLKSNQAWLEESVQEALEIKAKYPAKFFRSGEVYPYLGRDYRLQICQGPRMALRFAEDQIYFWSPKREEDFSEVLRAQYFLSFKRAYKQVARKLMADRLRFYSQKMGLKPAGLQIRGQKSIWGSCSPQNKISLNFKLIVAPLEVVDYVVIHELAHIRHKDHSKAFWALVEKHTEFRHFSRQWLKDHQFAADFLNKESELRPVMSSGNS